VTARAILILLLLTATAQAHQVLSRVSHTPAVLITLSYADGHPFAYEAYELYGDDPELPIQVGRTDAQGRILIMPETQRQMRIRAFTEDGHGIDTRLQIPAAEAAATRPSASAMSLEGPLLGLALLLTIFAVYQLYAKRNR
jgi:nickel transport protein